MSDKTYYHIKPPYTFVEYHDIQLIIHPDKFFVNIVELHEIRILFLPIIIVEVHKFIGRV